MPKCLHVVHVAVEIETNRPAILDAAIKCLQLAAMRAVRAESNLITNGGTSKVEVIE